MYTSIGQRMEALTNLNVLQFFHTPHSVRLLCLLALLSLLMSLSIDALLALLLSQLIVVRLLLEKVAPEVRALMTPLQWICYVKFLGSYDQWVSARRRKAFLASDAVKAGLFLIGPAGACYTEKQLRSAVRTCGH